MVMLLAEAVEETEARVFHLCHTDSSVTKIDPVLTRIEVLVSHMWMALILWDLALQSRC